MSYTVPSDTTLGELLGLQFNDAPGIATRQNQDGTWELTQWPDALGLRPTQEQVDGWVAGIDEARRARQRERIKAGLRDNTEDRQVLRAVVRLLSGSLVEARNALNAIRVAAVDASSFEDFQSRAAAIGVLTNRTWQEALTAAEQVIDAGQAEE